MADGNQMTTRFRRIDLLELTVKRNKGGKACAFMAVLLCIYFLPQPGLSQSESTLAEQSPARGPVLHGQVEHHESLPPLEADLQSGAPFAESAIERKAKYAGKWLKIPAWFAGTFQTRETYIESAFDYATGKLVQLKRVVPSAGMEQRGQQRDLRGGIWHYYVESGASKTDQTLYQTYNTVDWYGPEVVSDDRVVMRIQATSLVVDKNTGVIVDSFQREDLKTYVPRASNSIAVRYTSKSFDSRGNPRDMQTGRSIHQRVAPFAVVNNGDGVDYRALFRDYLESNHLGNLMPSE